MQVRVTSSIGDLASDLRTMAVTAKPSLARVVERNADRGARLAHDFAVRSAGKHGKHYPNAISAEPRGLLTWEYGPDASRPQGGMSFEFGSRNQPPHLDLARSADIVGPRLLDDVDGVVSSLFWPGA
jgi:hypothetical protein